MATGHLTPSLFGQLTLWSQWSKASQIFEVLSVNSIYKLSVHFVIQAHVYVDFHLLLPVYVL